MVAYELSTTIVFKHHRLLSWKAEFASFVAIGGVGLLVNGAVIYIDAYLLGLHYLIAKGLAAGFAFTCNYVARRQILFARRTPF